MKKSGSKKSGKKRYRAEVAVAAPVKRRGFLKMLSLLPLTKLLPTTEIPAPIEPVKPAPKRDPMTDMARNRPMSMTSIVF